MTSRQYTFINNTHGFSVSLIEGAQTLAEISKIHNIGPFAESFYQKTLLTSLQMVNFLKPNENLGFYIDSEEPYYRFKIEFSSTGTYRTLLLPEDFDDFPKTLTGKVRFTKTMYGKAPYTSLLEYKEEKLEELINDVITKSYQVNATTIVKDDKTSSLMVTKLPPSNVNKKIEDFEDLNLAQILDQYKDLFDSALLLKDSNVLEVEKLFEEYNLQYLGSKEIKFHCPCSKERMVNNLFSLAKEDQEHLFDEKDSLEIRCDYCNTNYDIYKVDLEDKKIQ